MSLKRYVVVVDVASNLGSTVKFKPRSAIGFPRGLIARAVKFGGSQDCRAVCSRAAGTTSVTGTNPMTRPLASVLVRKIATALLRLARSSPVLLVTILALPLPQELAALAVISAKMMSEQVLADFRQFDAG